MKVAVVVSAVSALALLGTFVAAQSVTPPANPVPYPDGYRTWAHVKSSVIGPTHANFATTGGFQHVYANPAAMTGYRTRAFPDGAVIAFEWLEMQEKQGAFSEGPRRQLDVMVKDAKLYASTGGWGFQRFAKDSRTELAATPTPQQCFTCHERLRKDGLVLSTYRP